MITEPGLSNIIDLINDMNKNNMELQNSYKSCDIGILSKYSERIQSWLLSELGIPKDNTFEMTKFHGDVKGDLHEDIFCRDFIDDWFYEYEVGSMSKEKLIFNLLNWKK